MTTAEAPVRRVSNADRDAASKFATCLGLFEGINNIRAIHIRALLLICLDPGQAINELGAELGITRATATRTLQQMTVNGRPGYPGWGLIFTKSGREMPGSDTRLVLVYPTEKGQELFKALSQTMQQ